MLVLKGVLQMMIMWEKKNLQGLMCQLLLLLHHQGPALYAVLEPVGLPSLPPTTDEIDALNEVPQC